MFVDASAIVAILLREPEADRLTAALDGSVDPFTSALAVFESAMAVARRRGVLPSVARRTVKAFLARSGVEVLPVDDRIGDLAIDAQERYGRGSGHRAKLNFGDCFAYAMAKAAGAPLLYKGEDFALTDLA